MPLHPFPIALSVAGSDSGGGAGIQADLRTFHAWGVFGTTVVTAVTAQNTLGVHAIHPVPLEGVRQQMQAVATDLTPAAVKTGMLGTPELVELVAREAGALGLPPLVVDPVMVATSGDRLISEAAVEAIRRYLIPRAGVVTPNLHEARILTGLPVADEAGMEAAARALVEMGAAAALVKGGHLEGPEAVDLLFDGATVHLWRRPRIATRHTHGTGCTLSAAIAAALAQRLPLHDAVGGALDYVARAIAAAPGIGGGSGPVQHLVGTPFMPGSALR